MLPSSLSLNSWAERPGCEPCRKTRQWIASVGNGAFGKSAQGAFIQSAQGGARTAAGVECEQTGYNNIGSLLTKPASCQSGSASSSRLALSSTAPTPAFSTVPGTTITDLGGVSGPPATPLICTISAAAPCITNQSGILYNTFTMSTNAGVAAELWLRADFSQWRIWSVGTPSLWLVDVLGVVDWCPPGA